MGAPVGNSATVRQEPAAMKSMAAAMGARLVRWNAPVTTNPSLPGRMVKLCCPVCRSETGSAGGGGPSPWKGAEQVAMRQGDTSWVSMGGVHSHENTV